MTVEIVKGPTYTYRRHLGACERGRKPDEWEFVAGPGRRWDGRLTVSEIAELPGVTVGRREVQERLAEGQYSMWTAKAVRRKVVRLDKRAAKRFLSLPRVADIPRVKVDGIWQR